uniref:Uncharacterized protein n=1 Tax=Anguilla anguilla TaxID=7936 RepID=A0A0E9RDF9_ANGAN
MTTIIIIMILKKDVIEFQRHYRTLKL